MKPTVVRPLRFILVNTGPIGRVPTWVLRQLMGYYGEWRRSRDILNSVDESTAVRSLPRAFISRASLSGSSNSLRTR